MKKSFFLWALPFAGTLLTTFQGWSQVALADDSVAMGPGYTNEIYYSMANGPVSTIPRNTWDIAFRTARMSSGIITNDGSGVMLYTYPKSDTNGWNAVDTSGLFAWLPLYNDPADWENGAFSRNAAGHPDYGWGIYNTTTHDLIGDSIYIIQLRDGSFRKLWIKRKYSSADVYFFRYANLDGSAPFEVILDCNNYLAKDFVGYTLQMNQVVDYQPAKTDWDLLFTGYMSIQPDSTYYPVKGVLNNDGIKVKKFEGVPLSFSDWSSGNWDSTRSPIGWNWKAYNGPCHIVKDSLVFFVKDFTGDIYKLIFTKYEGGSTGKIVFKKGRVFAAGLEDDIKAPSGFEMYPNPADDHLVLTCQGLAASGTVVTISDLQGRQMLQMPMAVNQSVTTYLNINTSALRNGIYLVTISSGESRIVKR